MNFRIIYVLPVSFGQSLSKYASESNTIKTAESARDDDDRDDDGQSDTSESLSFEVTTACNNSGKTGPRRPSKRNSAVDDDSTDEDNKVDEGERELSELHELVSRSKLNGDFVSKTGLLSSTITIISSKK